MKASEYETELKHLYGMAIKKENVALALEILEKAVVRGIEDIWEKDKEQVNEEDKG